MVLDGTGSVYDDTQGLKVSRSQGFKVSRSQGLIVSKSQGLMVSKSQAPKVSRYQGIKVSRSQGDNGSVWSCTGWYLVVLGQCGVLLVGTWCYRVSIGRYWVSMG